jgi:hypothetical protein
MKTKKATKRLGEAQVMVKQVRDRFDGAPDGLTHLLDEIDDLLSQAFSLLPAASDSKGQTEAGAVPRKRMQPADEAHAKSRVRTRRARRA